MHNNKYYYIFENTAKCSAGNLQIINESTVAGKTKYKFNTVLQESGVKNQNKRVYSQTICESIVDKLQTKVMNNSLLSEISHPMFISADKDLLQRRSTVVELENCAAIIRKLKFHNGQILGEMETLSGFKGPDLAALITDGVNIGFSLRALGSVKTLSDGTIEVTQPLIPITYDVVSNPSYVNARILEILPESLSDFISSDQTLLTESEDFSEYIKSDHIQKFENTANLEFLNKIITEHFNTAVKNIRFKF